MKSNSGGKIHEAGYMPSWLKPIPILPESYSQPDPVGEQEVVQQMCAQAPDE